MGEGEAGVCMELIRGVKIRVSHLELSIHSAPAVLVLREPIDGAF